jgi:hypothetical protein
MKRGKSWPRENRPMSSMDFSVRSDELFSRRHKKQNEIRFSESWAVLDAGLALSFVVAALIDLPLGEVGSAHHRQVKGRLWNAPRLGHTAVDRRGDVRMVIDRRSWNTPRAEHSKS